MMHHPKGEMCISCTKALDNCSHLPFTKMYVIERYEMQGTQYAEVACNQRIPVKNVN